MACMDGLESPRHTFERQSALYMSVICYVYIVIEVYKCTGSYLLKDSKNYYHEKQTDQECQTMLAERPPFGTEGFTLIRFFSDYFFLGLMR